jgi:hypothetical protein
MRNPLVDRLPLCGGEKRAWALKSIEVRCAQVVLVRSAALRAKKVVYVADAQERRFDARILHGDDGNARFLALWVVGEHRQYLAGPVVKSEGSVEAIIDQPDRPDFILIGGESLEFGGHIFICNFRLVIW